MKKVIVLLLVIVFFISFHLSVYSATINEADTEFCDTLKYALITSIRQPVDEAIVEIYKDDKDAPEGLTWDSYDAKLLKIRQVYGVGGVYEITLKVSPYYRAHITYGEDKVIVRTNGELIDFEHLKTYPKIDFH